MKDTLQETENRIIDATPDSAALIDSTDWVQTAIDLGKLLNDHNSGSVVVMDMRQLNFWTDFFIIATTTSSTHLSGLERHIKEFSRERDVEILRRSRKPDTDDEWALIDMGNIVIHLMSERLRSFFELERLWSSAPLIYEAVKAS